MNIDKNEIFHVHTYRCGHAENVTDEEYVKKAVSIGVSGIWFTDHAPFPGDPFGNRMNYTDLAEYINTLSILKQKYANKITIHIGLEIEYFPSFDKDGYYNELKANSNIEILLLGQHMAETSPGHYTFEWDNEQLVREEYIALGNAQIQGMKSGYFDVLAHPDRIFRRQKIWSENMSFISKQLITSTRQMSIPLEINESSKKQKHHYWQEFWNMASGIQLIYGLDAHSLDEIRLLS